MRIVTIKDVALRAGVSTKTVSRVINGEVHVRPEKRAAVQRVVDELDYRPNVFARSLSSSRSYLLGLFVDDPGSGYAADVLRGALRRCRERGYHLVVEPVDLTVPGWIDQVTASLRALRLDGAILTPPLCDETAILDVFAAAALPCVQISPRPETVRQGSVRMNDRAAASEMTAHLLALGHRAIGFIKGDPAHSMSEARFDGYLAALAAAAAPSPEQVREGDFSFRSGFALSHELLAAASPPTAIFASNDDMALGVLMAATKLGIAVPERLSIAGFDDAPTARAAWPQLTTIRQPKAEMAAAAVDMLANPRYRDNAVSADFTRLLDYTLVVRGSTAAAPSSTDH